MGCPESLFVFVLHKSKICLMLMTKVLTLRSFLLKQQGGVSCVTRLVEFL